MKVSRLDLRVILLWVAIFQFYLPNEKVYYIYQFFVACFIFVKSFGEIKKCMNYTGAFFYSLVITVSCIINRNSILITQVARGFTNALLIIDTLLLFKQYERIRNGKKLIELLFKISKFYACMNVLWIAVLIVTGKLHSAVIGEFLFSRGKFLTAYVLIFYLMFFYMAWNGNRFFPSKWKKGLLVIQAIGCITICALIETATGIIAIIMFLFFLLYGGAIVRIFENPLAIVTAIIGSMLLIFCLKYILQLSFVQNIIVNVLHEDISLTGRMELYTLLGPLVLKSGLFGGGFGSYVAATLAYHGWYNAQNGLAEIILTYGFLGGISFLLLTFVLMYKAKNKNAALYSAIMVFIVVAIVEIPFNNSFILLLSLLQIQYSNRLNFIDKGVKTCVI